MEPRTISLIYQNVEQVNDTVFVSFQIAEPFSFLPGAHGILESTKTFYNDSGRRKFAILKEQDSDELKIAFLKTDPMSELKLALLEGIPGDLYRLTGPLGSFTWVSNTKPVFAVAKEIGASSLAALLCGCEKKRHVEAFYYSETEPVFQDLLQKQVDQSMVHVDQTNDLHHIKRELEAFYHVHENNAYYYLSGVTSFVRELTEFLHQLGVRDSSIKVEDYIGYEKDLPE